MDSISEKIEQATQVSESRKEAVRQNYKYVKLTRISNIINSLHSTDFSNEPLMHNRMNRVHVLIWKIKEVKPQLALS
jgi:hypothetical protein